ncbi:arrestin domain-containing protein [Colletotrichum musicola]|uniref:Arrestin domain-containing protein n=1 Tax=Colletotrichum musicola TaxID=2175873 RepID=A0A8H6NKZ4_9PEZI|nr:arrestin domain-containing protein [Colletotrichum musicola]
MPKMGLDVNVDNHYTSKIYTNGSSVSGKVVICPERDMPFQCVQINLLGMSHARIDMLPTPKTVEDVFLRLDMPVHDTSYPANRVFQAGQTYHIPFGFKIPHALSKDACHGLAESGHIQDLHRRLPPTMGGWEKDDMSPVMTRIEYAVVARILQKRISDVGRPIEARLPIKVLPGFPEDAPLSVTDRDTRYTLLKTKSIRRARLSTLKDQAVVSAAQPGAVLLGPSGHQLSEVQSSVTVNFSLRSSSIIHSLPEINVGQARVEAITWFSGFPMKTLPELGVARDTSGTRHELKYSASVKLSSCDVEGASWHQETGSQGQGPVAWKATVKVPIQLPTTHNMFLPTFYSCYMARTYSLHLPITLSGTKVNLTVPLQVATQQTDAKASGPLNEDLPDFYAALAWG